MFASAFVFTFTFAIIAVAIVAIDVAADTRGLGLGMTIGIAVAISLTIGIANTVTWCECAGIPHSFLSAVSHRRYGDTRRTHKPLRNFLEVHLHFADRRIYAQCAMAMTGTGTKCC